MTQLAEENFSECVIASDDMALCQVKTFPYNIGDGVRRCTLVADKNVRIDKGSKIEFRYEDGSIYPFIVVDIKDWSKHNGERMLYRLVLRAATQDDYLPKQGQNARFSYTPSDKYTSISVSMNEIRSVWEFISLPHNTPPSLREIADHVRLSQTRVWTIMCFLHDSGYITKRGKGHARAYQVNLPLISGSVQVYRKEVA